MQIRYALNLLGNLNEINEPNMIVRAVLIENHSGDNIIYSNTVDAAYVIPPGVTVPINTQHLVSTVRFRSASNTTGSASVTLYDQELDTSRATPLQQLPGNVSITGTVTAVPSLPIGGRLSLNHSFGLVTIAHTTEHLVVQCDETTLTIAGFLTIYTTIVLPDATTTIVYLVSQSYLVPSSFSPQNSMIPFASDLLLPAGAIITILFSGKADFIVSY